MARTHVRTLGSGIAALALAGAGSIAVAPSANAATCTATRTTDGQGTYAVQVTCDAAFLSVTIVTLKNGKVKITVKFDGFGPGSKVKIFLKSDPVLLGEFTADANGSVTTDVTIPANTANGLHHLEAVGVDANGLFYSVSTPLTVTGSQLAGGGGLPFTGFELGAASLLGAGLLGAGTLAVVSGRKRKDSLSAV